MLTDKTNPCAKDPLRVSRPNLAALKPGSGKASLYRLTHDKSYLMSWLTSSFSDEDYFVTLTFRPFVHHSEEMREATTKEFLKRLNRKVYGKGFIKGNERLKYCGFFEVSRGGHLHVHALISRPTRLDRLAGKPFEDVIVETWTELDRAGRRVATDVTDMYEAHGVATYIMKSIKLEKHLSDIDVANLYLG